MMADSQVSVGGSLVYAWALLKQHWRAMWAVLALAALAETVYVAGVYALNNQLLVGGAVAQLITKLVLYGAVFRLALADRHPGDPAFALGHAGLQWRRMEWRLLGAGLLLLLFLAIIAVLGVVLVSAVALGIIVNQGGAAPPATPQAVLAALGPNGQTVVSVILSLVILALLYCYVRLSLAFAATADTGKVSVLASWSLTKTHGWRILGALILVQLPLMLIESLIAVAVDGSGPGTGAPMSAESAMLSALVVGALFGCVIAPLSAGVLAYYYRHPSGPPPGGTS
jgi:hypothetical protein